MTNKYLSQREQVRKEVFAQHGIDASNKLVIGVGFGDYRKGVDLFIEAGLTVMESRKDVAFLWVGDLEPQMQEMKKQLLTGNKYEKNFYFVGKQSDPMRYYTAADIYLLTSREDPFPTVVMEAMYSYLPVVAFDGCGGFVEIINENTGMLVPKEDAKAMGKAVLEYLNNPEKLRKTGEYAHNFMAVEFRFVPYVARLLELLKQNVPSVSVVIPNYNYECYLKNRIDSVLQQNYPIKEIILLDDCSTDNSLQILREYEEKYKGLVRVIVNEQNAGNVFKQWAKGFHEAKGDYVWIAEADDLSNPEFLSKVMSKLISDEDMVMCYSQSLMIDENGNVTGPNYFVYTDDVSKTDWQYDYVISAEQELREHLSVKNTIPNVSAVVFKNRNFDKILEGAMGYTVAGDWRVYVDLLLQGGTVGFIAESLNSHRRHSNSVTTDLKKEKHYAEIVSMQDYTIEHVGADPRKAWQYREFLKDYFGFDKEETEKNN
jgi:glycosyltransferase involved in cell wall biosynthesis